MSLTPGTRLGHYEIIELIGSGGMGEVYKARDPRLNRTVAVKVLREDVSGRPDARARFERETQTIASLNHPNICVVYDVGCSGQIDFLVMELIEGETVARQLERGPLPLDRALKYAMAIADALDKAHRSGVTHRDLKPGNIMITGNGVKLLDFGLAKLRGNKDPSTLSQAPTRHDVTAEGVIIGSLQYMAPEQLEGREADARTDLFAFGATLYEMVTGKKAFEGKSSVSLMSAILKDTPRPIREVLPVAPQSLDRIIATCLAKDPEERWQSSRDLYRELKWVADAEPGASNDPHEARLVTQRRRQGISLELAATIALLAILIGAAAVWTLKPNASAPQAELVQLSVTLPPGDELDSFPGPPAALSPDGRLLAYVSARPGSSAQLYLRAMDNPEPKLVTGSEGASLPFFSPSGQWVAFFAQGKLKKSPVTGGAVETVCDAARGTGGSWSADDVIYFAPLNTSGLSKVSAAGGTPQQITTLDRDKGEVSHRWPQVLPGARAVLFTVWTGPGWEETELQVVNLVTGERRSVVHGSRNGRYDQESGHLVYYRQGTDSLLAAPFDLDRLQLAGGPPVALTPRVRDTSEGGEFALSDSGALIYTPSSPEWYESRLVWVDRHGVIEPLSAPLRDYQEPVLSPDGRRFAISIAGPSFSAWIFDLARPTLTPLTSSGSSQAPMWTPDGTRVVYRGTRKGFRNIFQRMADGSRDEERLSMGDGLQTPGAFSPDGRLFAFTASDSKTSTDILLLSMEGVHNIEPLLNTVYREWNPHISRDGRWLAYVSTESGSEEVYVRPFPKLDGKWKISTDGGTEPVWSRDELFYRNNDRMMAVGISATADFSATLPRLLFEGKYKFSGTTVSGYDVTADGKRFLMVQPAESARPANEIDIVLNWSAELKKAGPKGD